MMDKINGCMFQLMMMTYQKNIKLFGTKSHGDEVTDFYDKNILKIESNHTSLAAISSDSVLKKDENYYPQVFLRECKHIEQKVIRHFNNNLNNFSYSSESDEE